MNVFGVSCAALMESQRADYPELRVPRVLLALVGALEASGALATEGVFRVPVRCRCCDQHTHHFRPSSFARAACCRSFANTILAGSHCQGRCAACCARARRLRHSAVRHSCVPFICLIVGLFVSRLLWLALSNGTLASRAAQPRARCPGVGVALQSVARCSGKSRTF